MFLYSCITPIKEIYCLVSNKKAHKISDEKKQLFLGFLACFIVQEHFINKATKELLNEKLSDEVILLSLEAMFFDSGTQDTLSNCINKEAKEFFITHAREPCITCTYLQKTLLLTNKFLKCISTIDPTARGHNVAC